MDRPLSTDICRGEGEGVGEGAKAASAESPRGLRARGTARCCCRTALPVPDGQTVAHLFTPLTTAPACIAARIPNGEGQRVRLRAF